VEMRKHSDPVICIVQSVRSLGYGFVDGEPWFDSQDVQKIFLFQNILRGPVTHPANFSIDTVGLHGKNRLVPAVTAI
jgi:hypothetical protein